MPDPDVAGAGHGSVEAAPRLQVRVVRIADESLQVQRQWPFSAYADFLYRGMAGQLLNSLETD